MTEAGLKALLFDLQLTVFAPAGLPVDVKAELNTENKTVLAKPGAQGRVCKGLWKGIGGPMSIRLPISYWPQLAICRLMMPFKACGVIGI
jgi:hypothetical protein